MTVLDALREHLEERADDPLPADLAAAVLDAIAACCIVPPEAQTVARAKLRYLGAKLLPDGTPYERAVALADRLATFERRAWPLIRRGLRPPRDDVESVLAAVLGSGVRLPRSTRRLFDLLRD